MLSMLFAASTSGCLNTVATQKAVARANKYVSITNISNRPEACVCVFRKYAAAAQMADGPCHRRAVLCRMQNPGQRASTVTTLTRTVFIPPDLELSRAPLYLIVFSIPLDLKRFNVPSLYLRTSKSGCFWNTLYTGQSAGVQAAARRYQEERWRVGRRRGWCRAPGGGWVGGRGSSGVRSERGRQPDSRPCQTS